MLKREHEFSRKINVGYLAILVIESRNLMETCGQRSSFSSAKLVLTIFLKCSLKPCKDFDESGRQGVNLKLLMVFF